MVKNLPAVQETWVSSLCWEHSLEKGMATHSSILAWRIPWTEEPGGLQSMGSQKSQTWWSDKTTAAATYIYTCDQNSGSEVIQSCLTLCDPVDCSLPGSTPHGILQARIL